MSRRQWRMSRWSWKSTNQRRILRLAEKEILVGIQTLAIPLYVVSCDVCGGDLELEAGMCHTFPDEDAAGVEASNKGWWVGYDEGMGQSVLCPNCTPEEE